MIQTVLAQRPTASLTGFEVYYRRFIPQVDAPFLLLLHKDACRIFNMLFLTSLARISSALTNPLTLRSEISVKENYLSCAGY